MAIRTYKSIITLNVNGLNAPTKRLDWLNEYKNKITVPSKNLIITDGEIKSFSDKQKLREFSTTKPALRQILNRLI